MERPDRNKEVPKAKKDINAYRSLLISKYGASILDQFDTVYKNEAKFSLKDISDVIGVTKARAGQIFKDLHGMSYREARRIAKESEDPDEDISNGDRPLFLTIPVEMSRKLGRYSRTHGISKASIVRDCLAGFLENDAYNRISF